MKRWTVLIVVLGCSAPAKAPSKVTTVQIQPAVPIEPSRPAPHAEPACPPSCIPGSDVADSPPNRMVIEFCERYRKALVDRDVAALLALASPRYLDDGGTPDPSDDMRYEDLARFLARRFDGIDAIRYEVRYRKIEHAERTVRVTLSYSGSFRLASGAWRQRVDDNVLELERSGDTFAIVRGM